MFGQHQKKSQEKNSMIDETSFIDDAHDNAIKWADNILATPPGQVLILDTETTGLGADAEIIQLAMIDLGGNEIMNTLVRPKYAIPRLLASSKCSRSNSWLHVIASWWLSDCKSIHFSHPANTLN
jgi:hypothetical protein